MISATPVYSSSVPVAGVMDNSIDGPLPKPSAAFPFSPSFAPVPAPAPSSAAAAAAAAAAVVKADLVQSGIEGDVVFNAIRDESNHLSSPPLAFAFRLPTAAHTEIARRFSQLPSLNDEAQRRKLTTRVVSVEILYHDNTLPMKFVEGALLPVDNPRVVDGHLREDGAFVVYVERGNFPLSSSHAGRPFKLAFVWTMGSILSDVHATHPFVVMAKENKRGTRMRPRVQHPPRPVNSDRVRVMAAVRAALPPIAHADPFGFGDSGAARAHARARAGAGGGSPPMDTSGSSGSGSVTDSGDEAQSHPASPVSRKRVRTSGPVEDVVPSPDDAASVPEPVQLVEPVVVSVGVRPPPLALPRLSAVASTATATDDPASWILTAEAHNLVELEPPHVTSSGPIDLAPSSPLAEVGISPLDALQFDPALLTPSYLSTFLAEAC